MDQKKQWQLFLSIFKAGFFAFGGGPAIIPFLQKEVVERKKLVTEEEFTTGLSLANTLPGPIATKMGGYIGYRVGGVFGLISATVATVLPSAFLMIFLLTTLNKYTKFDFVQGMTKGVLPVVTVMMFVMMLDFFKKSKKKLPVSTLVILLSASGIALFLFHVHPGIIISVLLLLALLLPVKKGDNVQ